MKDPAFLFYSKDYYEGTRMMLPEERACFIDLMIYQHQNSIIPDDTKRLTLYCSGISEDIIIATLNNKFIKTDTGWYNERLYKEMTVRSTKGSKNKLIGTFAHVLKSLNLNQSDQKILKNRFNVDELLKLDTEWCTSTLTEWCKNGVPFIEDANANTNEDLDIDPFKEKNWRKSFAFYQLQLSESHDSLIKNKEWLSTQERLNPNINILLSIEKAVINFWSTEAGWKNKKAKRTKDIDWKSTLTNAIALNKVYNERIQTNNRNSFASDTTKETISGIVERIEQEG